MKRLTLSILGIIFPMLVLGLCFFYFFHFIYDPNNMFAPRWNPDEYYFGFRSLYNMISWFGKSLSESTDVFNFILGYWDINIQQVVWSDIFTKISESFELLGSFNFDFTNIATTLETMIEYINQCFMLVINLFYAGFMIFAVYFSLLGFFLAGCLTWVALNAYYFYGTIILFISGYFNSSVHSGYEYNIPDWREVWDFTKISLSLVTM